ncbi:MAG: HmuY family protein [Myxococcaceae bacterium]|nr:HmuY family protein [Myxococcaceae bacterium]
MKAMTRVLGRMWCAMLWVGMAGCAPDLIKDYPFDGELSGTGHFTAEAQGDGTTLSFVDATNKEGFVYVDLDKAEELSTGDALDKNTWELSFQRFTITLNGGGGGLGNVEAAVLLNADFDALTQAPADGYRKDGSEGVFTAVEGGWYYYDLGKHKLTAKTELTYVIHSTDDAYFKLQMVGYYDAAGTPANPSFRWAKIAPP